MSEVKKTKTTKKDAKDKEAKPTKVIKEKKTVKDVIKKETKIETKKNKGLLSKEEQKKTKVLSKIIRILAKIGKICGMIILPFIVLGMIIVPIVFSHLEISGNIIDFKDVRLVMRDKHITIKLGDGNYVSNDEIEGLDSIVEFFSQNSKEKIIAYLEVTLVFFLTMVLIEVYLLMQVEKLFENIEREKTPFIDENVKYVQMISKLVLVSFIASFVFQLILEIIIPDNFSINLANYGIIEILVLFLITYVFKYAVRLQEKEKTVIYDEE